MIEGTVASIPPQGGRKHPQQEFIRGYLKCPVYLWRRFLRIGKIVQHRQEKVELALLQK